MAYCVLVFDLDDTLIDTSKYLIPLKLRSALEAMIREGLEVRSFDAALQQLRESPFAVSNGKKAITDLLTTMSADEKYIDVGFSAYLGATELDDKTNTSISSIPGAVHLLQKLYEKISLALVTRGLADLQMKKISSAGLIHFFQWISIANYGKRSEYGKVLNHFRARPDEVVVCGDSIDHDLVPAVNLGMRAVHFRYGWGGQQPAFPCFPTASIDRLEELERILFSREENLH